MNTPKILYAASRQYCHNNGKRLVTGYDKKKIDKIVSILIDKHINEILQYKKLQAQACQFCEKKPISTL